MRLFPIKLSAQSDEQLMLRAAHGSDKAFEELYNRHIKRLQGFLMRRLGGDSELAADFSHDTFLRLYAARETYRESHSFTTWLYSIAYNLCKNRYRQFVPDNVAITEKEEATKDGNDIVVEMDEALLHDKLRQVLGQLPEPYAIIFSLHYEEELTIPQVAQIIGVPEGTVKSRLHKAMTIIKNQLKEYESH